MTLGSRSDRLCSHWTGNCSQCSAFDGGSRCFVWFDQRRAATSPSPFHEVAHCSSGRLEVGARDPMATIQAARPGFLVFEFDTPDRRGVEALQLVNRSFPQLPLMMLTEAHSDTLAVWALRMRVWDYLVKPLPSVEIAHRIEALCQAARHARHEPQRRPAVPHAAALRVAG